jgi:protein O-mannosyl-transferase
VLLVFANSLTGALIFDSKGLIVDDTRVHVASGENIGLILRHSYWWHKGPSGLYRPLTTLSYLFNYAVLGNGQDPEGYHALNLALHTFNVLLVYGLAFKLTRQYVLSVLLAALWAVHPIVTEAVTNIAGRPDLLAGAAVLGGLWLYLKSADAGGARRVALLGALAVTTAAGVFSKENSVIVVGIVIAYELAHWQNRRVPLILGCVAIWAPLQIMLSRREAMLAAEGPAVIPFTDNPLIGAAFWQSKLTAIAVLGRQFGQVIWPAKLSADYSYHQIPLARGSFEDWLQWLAVAALAAAVILIGRRHRLILFLGAFAFLTLLPTANLLFPIGTIRADRFLYLPSIALLGLFLALAHWLWRRLGAPRHVWVLASVVLCCLAARTWARNRDWHDELALARATATAAPESYKSHRILAETEFVADPGHTNIGAVLGEAEQGLAILQSVPDDESNPDLYRLGGDGYLIQSDQLRSAGNATQSREAAARAASVLEHGAVILESTRERQRKELEAHGIKRLVLNAGRNEDIYRLLSDAYLRLGDGDKAFAFAIDYRKRAPLKPAAYSQLATVLAASGQPEDAATALMEGMLVTSDMDLRRQLIAFYRSGLPAAACALVAGPNGPAINPSCALVHQNLCEAAIDAIRIRLATDRRDLANELRRTSALDYGCPTGPLDEALAAGRGRK